MILLSLHPSPPLPTSAFNNIRAPSSASAPGFFPYESIGQGIRAPRSSTAPHILNCLTLATRLTGAYMDQRSNLPKLREAHGRNAKVSNRTWEIRPSLSGAGTVPACWPRNAEVDHLGDYATLVSNQTRGGTASSSRFTLHSKL
jgi:hypothetical protein